MDWEKNALCREEDPELFFVVGKEELNQPQIRQAKAVCFACPVAGDCLAEALAKGRQGIWGGTTDDERRAMLRRRAALQEAVA